MLLPTIKKPPHTGSWLCPGVPRTWDGSAWQPEAVAHLGIEVSISGGGEAGSFTICLDVWPYPDIMQKFGGGVWSLCLRFLTNNTRVFRNTQEDENINWIWVTENTVGGGLWAVEPAKPVEQIFDFPYAFNLHHSHRLVLREHWGNQEYIWLGLCQHLLTKQTAENHGGSRIKKGVPDSL